MTEEERIYLLYVINEPEFVEAIKNLFHDRIINPPVNTIHMTVQELTRDELYQLFADV
jgi:hypothetical protein